MGIDEAATRERAGTPAAVTVAPVGRKGFEFARDLMADVCELSHELDDDSRFQASAHALNIGAAVFTDMHASPLRYRRTARHIARSGYDHYEIGLNISGHSHVRSGRQAIVFHVGDIGLLDTTRATDTVMRAAPGGTTRSIACFVPRAMLAPLLASHDAEHGAVIRGDTPAGRLIGEHLRSIMHKGDRMSAAAAGTALQGLLGLLAGGFGAAAEALLPLREAMRQAAATAIKRHIEENLGSPGLTTEAICMRFAVSRATVYRIFDEENGLVAYIQRRRLQRAFKALMSARMQRQRILDLALDSHFASEATFNRAFRRTFGVPPGEVRTLAAAARSHEQAAAWRTSSDADAVRWIRGLSA